MGSTELLLNPTEKWIGWHTSRTMSLKDLSGDGKDQEWYGWLTVGDH